MKIIVILVLLLPLERQTLAEMELFTEMKVIKQNLRGIQQDDIVVQEDDTCIQQDDTGFHENDTNIHQDDTETVLPTPRHYRHTTKFARNTVKGQRCIFPFMFRGIQFVDCAPGIHQPNTWCATSIDVETSELKEWEVCSLDKRKDDDTCTALSPSSCLKTGISTLCPLMCTRGMGAIQPTRDKLTIKGTRCIFPFIDRGVHYNECAPDGQLGTPWCATRIKDNREFSQWEFCAPTASELASMNRFGGMNDEAMEDFLESLQGAKDFSGSCLDETKEIYQRIDKMKELLKHRNSTKPIKAKQIKAANCADPRLQKEGSFGFTRTQIFPFGDNDRYTRYHSHRHNKDDSHYFGFDVLCDLDEHGGGWTVIQMRRNVHPRENFKREWHDYEEGFGQIDGEFWIGLKVIHALTAQDPQELHIWLEDWEGATRWARYSQFDVASASETYKLSVGGYTGDAGDAMATHNNAKFFTLDRDEGDCAKSRNGGWWYNGCFHHANLNGLPDRGTDTQGQQGINLYQWHGHKYSLKSVTMKIRPRHMYG